MNNSLKVICQVCGRKMVFDSTDFLEGRMGALKRLLRSYSKALSF